MFKLLFNNFDDNNPNILTVYLFNIGKLHNKLQTLFFKYNMIAVACRDLKGNLQRLLENSGVLLDFECFFFFPLSSFSLVSMLEIYLCKLCKINRTGACTCKELWLMTEAVGE